MDTQTNMCMHTCIVRTRILLLTLVPDITEWLFAHHPVADDASRDGEAEGSAGE